MSKVVSDQHLSSQGDPEKQGALLIQLARDALEAVFSHVVSFASLNGSLAESFSEKRGVFVSLWANGAMRGCIGTPFPDQPLGKMIQEFALKAAFEDSRYLPVTAEELPKLEIQIILLTSPQPIQPKEIKIGVHGLIVRHIEGIGVLLPDAIMIEQQWTVRQFLANTCLKGGLHHEAWQDEGTEIYAFETRVIKESQFKA